MGQPKDKPLAVRCRPELRARLETYAKAHNLTRNGAAVRLWEIGLGVPPDIDTADPKAKIARARNALAERGLDTSMVQMGPSRLAPGALLERDPKKRARWKLGA